MKKKTIRYYINLDQESWDARQNCWVETDFDKPDRPRVFRTMKRARAFMLNTNKNCYMDKCVGYKGYVRTYMYNIIDGEVRKGIVVNTKTHSQHRYY